MWRLSLETLSCVLSTSLDLLTSTTLPYTDQAHTLYALTQNYTGHTRPVIASLLSVPQRYFLPSRIRAQFKERLEAVGLWDKDGVEDEEEEERVHWSVLRRARRRGKKRGKKGVFERERVS